MADQPRNIAVIGLGKLGSPIAACLAAHGFGVVGVDQDSTKVEALGLRKAAIYEPGLAEMLAQAGPRLRATSDLSAAIHECDISLVIVPTPSDASGGFSLKHLVPACRLLGQALRHKISYHAVAIVSTVMPGATGGELREVLEATSGRRCGDGWGLCYSPEFVALGSVIHDFLHPDFILIGESDRRAGDWFEAMYRQLHDPAPAISRMSFVNAELAKIAVNTFITTKITFANMLAGICERLPGGDVDVVTRALGLDSRIGGKYLTGAVGYGGPCFPRDNVAITSLARSLDAPAALAQAVDDANRRQVDRLAELVKGHLRPGGTIGVLGLAYKPNTDVVEQSQGVLLANALAIMGHKVVAYDPAAGKTARQALSPTIQVSESLAKCLEASDVLVVVTPWDEFLALDAAALDRAGDSRVVIDCWRVLSDKRLGDNVRYLAVGVGPSGDTARGEGRRVA